MCEQADERLKNAGAAQNGAFSGILCMLLESLSYRSPMLQLVDASWYESCARILWLLYWLG